MEYAIELFIPFFGGLLLGAWLNRQFHVSLLWTLVLGILGFLAGLGIIYKRMTYPELYSKQNKEPEPVKGKQRKR